MKKISIVMPNYNKASFVDSAIQSVLNQTYTHFELIIIDDGSTDNSVEIINSIKDNRIKLIKQKNSGAAVARNNGIKNAQYDYIAFLDSDDIWLPWFLEKMNSLIIQFPEAGAYCCNYLKEKVELNKDYSKYYSDNSDDYLIDNYFNSVLYGSESMTASTTVVKKEVFKKCGAFPVGLNNWEDFDMWLRVALYNDVCYTNCICAVYNDVPNSASRNKADLHAPVFDNYKMHIKMSGIKGEKKKSFIMLVAQKEGHAAYEHYLVDRNGRKALKRVLPFLPIRFKDKTYWSAVLQFIFTPERVLEMNVVGANYDKENNKQD